MTQREEGKKEGPGSFGAQAEDADTLPGIARRDGKEDQDRNAVSGFVQPGGRSIKIIGL
jgi:hypothetical protein